MPRHVVDRLAEALDRHCAKPLGGSRILLSGLAYKKNVGDMRESPAFAIMEMIEERGGRVDYHDPQVPVITPTREHARFTGRTSVELDAQTLEAADAVLICTDHDDIDYPLIARHAALVIDTRNAMGARKLACRALVKA
jgi:UDP-N-acetyl-D-glucosamine dehydrogenase